MAIEKTGVRKAVTRVLAAGALLAVYAVGTVTTAWLCCGNAVVRSGESPERLLTRARTSTKPAPYSLSVPTAPTSSAVEVRAERICVGDADGATSRASTAAPATYGVAMDVPLSVT